MRLASASRSFASLCAALLVTGALLTCADGASAASLRRTVAFEPDRWIDLDYKDGAVTIHRIRVERRSSHGFKSVVSRPSHTDFVQDVQIQIEYSNSSTKDWKVKGSVVWLDASGEAIDGYRGSEDVDEKKSHELATMLFSTLRYGLAQARQLSIELEIVPD